GEYRHLVLHGRLAEKVGVRPENIIIAEDGDVVEFTEDGVEKLDKVEYGRVFVDGKGVGDVGAMVLKDRSHLSQDGLVLAVIALNGTTGEFVYGPEIITRGLVFEDESAELLQGAKRVVMDTLANINAEARTEQLEVKEEIRRALRRFFNKALERKPVILPIIIEI
ncbi:MAG: ribonuclease J, partial [Deltaproteobacteria bacterium]|nr:ribonuclease J [Deltaproteobacteria bacterium]